MPFREPRNSARRLAHGRLRVKPSFAGHDDIRVLDMALKPGLFDYDVYAAFELGAKKRPEGEAKPACRAGAREKRVSARNLREMRKRRVKLGYHLRRRALLRAKHRARPAWSAKRIGDIAGNAKLAAAKFLAHGAALDTRKIRKRAAASFQFRA